MPDESFDTFPGGRPKVKPASAREPECTAEARWGGENE
jgi:hypothetical protein